MNDSTQRGRRISAFEYWLRTGRRAPPVQYKFNGWHDPDDGKFTFKGSGTYYGQGSTGGDRLAMARPRKSPTRQPGRGDDSWQGSGFIGGGGGSFGGGGATGSGWETPDERRAREVRQSTPATSPKLDVQGHTLGSIAPKQNRQTQTQYSVRKGDTLSSIAARAGVTTDQMMMVNSLQDADKIKAGQTLTIPARAGSQPGWVSVRAERLTFEIDQAGRTRVARGALGGPASARSKKLQAEAGKPDRQATDDGGHIIAPRLGGPKAAYNHFAQDSNFNRGEYRVLEGTWAKALSEGKSVSVKIDVKYPTGSKRPNQLRVESTVAGTTKIRHFTNAKGGRPSGN